MTLRSMASAFLLLLVVATLAQAGRIYTITSADGKTSYEVKFEGGKSVDWLTGFDPESKKFVYIYVQRNTETRPKPVGTFWDHTTGETILLYKFPGVAQPLPEIKSVKDIKFFPLTNDKNFKVMASGFVD